MQKTSSFIGPFVSSAIIDRSGNGNMPFTFLLALGVLSTGILLCVNVPRSKHECRQYLEDEAIRIYKLHSLESVATDSVPAFEGPAAAGQDRRVDEKV